MGRFHQLKLRLKIQEKRMNSWKEQGKHQRGTNCYQFRSQGKETHPNSPFKIEDLRKKLKEKKTQKKNNKNYLKKKKKKKTPCPFLLQILRLHGLAPHGFQETHGQELPALSSSSFFALGVVFVFFVVRFAGRFGFSFFGPSSVVFFCFEKQKS